MLQNTRGAKTLYIGAPVVCASYPYKEATIWNKFAVGILAIATIAAARVLIRRRRPAENTAADPSEDFKDVEGLYAAGL